MGVSQTSKQEEALEPASGSGAAADRLSLAARKRAAIELIRSHERALRRTARRYSICADDADDAFQRAIEILLRKAPTTERGQLIRWTQTVTKHEALAVRATRERSGAVPPAPSREGPEEDWTQLLPSDSAGPGERTERRELIERSREALALLKPQELRALTLLAEGYSYDEIGEITGWTRTKVNRCLVEGRQRFRSSFRESESGERCEVVEPMISRCCDGEASEPELETVRNHLAVCGACRSSLRAFRAAPASAIALLPAAAVHAGGPGLLERAHEAAFSLAVRLGSRLPWADSGLGTAAAGGGSRGAGMVATAKLLAACAGTAGGAAACVAAGVVPAPALVPSHHETAPAHHEVVATPPDISAHPVLTPPPEPEAPVPHPQHPTGSGGSNPEPAQDRAAAPPPDPAPAPTPTEQEFTPEAAGTPIDTGAAPSAPATAAPPPESSVPVGGGSGEFGP